MILQDHNKGLQSSVLPVKTGFGEEENRKEELEVTMQCQSRNLSSCLYTMMQVLSTEQPEDRLRKRRETYNRKKNVERLYLEKKHARSLNIQRRSRQQEHASETNTQWTARLQQLRRSQEARIANETEEQRAARLQQLRQSQEVRIANETEEQRAARLQHDGEQHRTVNSGVPLLHQPAVQKKN